MKNNILIIGTYQSGKTHFGGQLYGRLQTDEFEFKLENNTPADLTIFKEILDKLEQGLSGEHTPSEQNLKLELPITNSQGEKFNIIYPDYAGEQISNTIKTRKFNERWQKEINQSNNWMLFIRLNEIELIEDVTNRWFSHYKKPNDNKPEFEGINRNSQIFFIELLQMFLFIKGKSAASTDKPHISILLSCWDELNLKFDTIPSDELQKRMPLFYEFIKTNWENNLRIIGLSSTQFALDKEKPNEDYVHKGPEEFGYVILENGKKSKDLTLALNLLNDNFR